MTFSAVVDAIAAPGANVVDEIINGSRSLTNAIDRGADTFIELMIEVSKMSFIILGAVSKAGVSVLFFALLGYSGYEISFHTADTALNVLAIVIMLLGAIPVFGGVVLMLVGLLQALVTDHPLRHRSSGDPWIGFLFADVGVIFAILTLRGAGFAFQSPLLAFIQQLIEPALRLASPNPYHLLH